MAADPALVKKYLQEVEDDRKSGRMSQPPTWLQPGNILGGKSAAYAEAVKQQGQMLNPKPAPGSDDDIMSAQSDLRKKIEKQKKTGSY